MEENGEKLKIALGSASSQKSSYLREVLVEIGIKAEIIPQEVVSGVSEQPLCEAETKKGAINRAKEALRQTPEADFGLGMEIGYHLNKEGKYEMFCCASIVDKNSFAQSCFSSRFLLPPFHQEILKKGKYLGEFVREYKREINKPVTNYIRELIRGRKPLISEAARNVLLVYLGDRVSKSRLLDGQAKLS
jgi:non-canonical (house-cleaning) NTP pyrophosphatase